MAKSQEEQYSEFSKKFNQLLEQFRSQNKDITVLKDILQKQLEYDTTLAGQRTPRARAEKRDREVVDKKQLKHLTEQQKLFKKMNKDLNSINKNMDKFVKSEQSRAKIFGKTLQEGLKEDLKDVLSPLLGIGDLPFIRSIKDATVAAFKGQKDLSDKSKAQLESSEKATAAMDSIDQMTADIRDMLADIHSHFVGGPTPSEKREMELEKKRLALKQKETVTSKDADAGKERDGEAEFDVAEVVETALGVGFGQLLGKGLVSAFGAAAGMTMWTKVAGVFAVAMKSLGFIGVALAAFFTGTFLYEQLIAPWLDDYFERDREEYRKRLNESSIKKAKASQKQATIGKDGELAFEITDEKGNRRIVGEKEAMAHRKEMAQKLGLPEEEIEAQGFVKKKMFAVDEKSGKVVMGKKHFTQEEAKKTAERKQRFGETKKSVDEGKTIQEEDDVLEHFVLKAMLSGSEHAKLLNQFITNNGLDHHTVTNHLFATGGVASQMMKILMDASHSFGDLGAATKEQKMDVLSEIFDGFITGALENEEGPGTTLTGIFYSNFKKAEIENFGEMGPRNLAVGKARNAILKSLQAGQMPIALARGGLISGPINALVGEAGPEVVMPLRDSASVIGKALVEAQRQAPLLGVIPQFGPMGDMPDDLGLNALIKGGAFGAPGRGQGGQQIIAPSFSNPTTNSTVVNNINNGLPDHPAFMQERRDRNDSFLWAGL